MRTITLEEQEQIKSIIQKCKVCYVGMSDEKGVPYVLPMNFGFLGNIIYLHSAQEGKSISILDKNPKVCITFCTEPELVWQNEEVACSYRVRSESIICNGEVVFEEDYDEKVKALDIIMRQYSDRDFNYSEPSVKNVKIWKVDIQEISAREYGVPGVKAIKYKDRFI
ncbi:MAG: pyridoxamine 5'-phosphate oxidase family protein [Fermentimonas sp.]|nr:pyridoxamine 5'-phosphate oxidase family protein [Fermentimonas sp.]